MLTPGPEPTITWVEPDDGEYCDEGFQCGRPAFIVQAVDHNPGGKPNVLRNKWCAEHSNLAEHRGWKS